MHITIIIKKKKKLISLSNLKNMIFLENIII